MTDIVKTISFTSKERAMHFQEAKFTAMLELDDPGLNNQEALVHICKRYMEEVQEEVYDET